MDFNASNGLDWNNPDAVTANRNQIVNYTYRLAGNYTATLRVVFAGVEVFTGPLAIEDGTDFAQPWTKLLTCFTARQNGQLSAILGGTVAGARIDFLVLSPDEPMPF